MAIIHIATFAAYIVAQIIYYVMSTQWDSASSKQENSYYVSWSLSVVLLTAAQLTLIYIFWGLSETWIEFDEEKTIEPESDSYVQVDHVDESERNSSLNSADDEDVTSGTHNDMTDDSAIDFQKYPHQEGTEEDGSDRNSMTDSEEAMAQQMRRTTVRKQLAENVE